MMNLKELPSPSYLFSIYASLSACLMLVRTMVLDLIPTRVQIYLITKIERLLFWRASSMLTLLIDEFWVDGFKRNEVYDAAMVYLGAKIGSTDRRIRVGKVAQQNHVLSAMAEGEEIVDYFDKIKLTWRFVTYKPDDKSKKEKYFELNFDKRFKEKVTSFYLAHVQDTCKTIQAEQRVLQVHLPWRNYSFDGGSWVSVDLRHPATFDTIAMDSVLKKDIIDDLDRFVARKEYYKRIGKAWKRGYLLYGPPGTGKSSLIAAMANYLKFDVYDLDLATVQSNMELRKLLMDTAGRSIIVIEDIDCSANVRDRRNEDESKAENNSKSKQLTLSGLLNSIDGLWSSCGEQRIIVFTTNHKDRLDPALLRPGRMDRHIYMSFCTADGFRLLARNYLGIHEHPHFKEIEGLLRCVEVTPAVVAEELMVSDDPNAALEGLLNFLKQKKMEGAEIKVGGAHGVELQGGEDVEER